MIFDNYQLHNDNYQWLCTVHTFVKFVKFNVMFQTTKYSWTKLTSIKHVFYILKYLLDVCQTIGKSQLMYCIVLITKGIFGNTRTAKFFVIQIIIWNALWNINGYRTVKITFKMLLSKYLHFTKHKGLFIQVTQ